MRALEAATYQNRVFQPTARLLEDSRQLRDRRRCHPCRHARSSCQSAREHFKQRSCVSQTSSRSSQTAKHEETYRASKDCWMPVPEIRTSKLDPSRESMIRLGFVVGETRGALRISQLSARWLSESWSTFESFAHDRSALSSSLNRARCESLITSGKGF